MCLWLLGSHTAGGTFSLMLWSPGGWQPRWEGRARRTIWIPGIGRRYGSPALVTPPAKVTGEYFYHLRPRAPNPASRDAERWQRLLDACQSFSGVELPAS